MFIFVTQQGPGSVWCDVDVVEFSYFGVPEPTSSKEQLFTEIVDDLRGSGSCIGSGSQVVLDTMRYLFIGYDLKLDQLLFLLSLCSNY